MIEGEARSVARVRLKTKVRKPTMNHSSLQTFSRMWMRVILPLMAVAALALGGCAEHSDSTTNENAAENRQYMAQLNQKTDELSDVLSQFQAAVSSSDTVGMEAAAAKADKIVESVKALNPPTSEQSETATLAAVKDLYVEGLEGINVAMKDYARLYGNVAAGSVSKEDFDRDLAAVQQSSNAAVEKITAADKELTDLANE